MAFGWGGMGPYGPLDSCNGKVRQLQGDSLDLGHGVFRGHNPIVVAGQQLHEGQKHTAQASSWKIFCKTYKT